MAVPAMDGTMAASYLTMRGQKWMIGQHDDRFYHRRRWERSERSEPTSASRIEYPNRCDWRCSHDRERCIRRVRNNSVGRCHVEIFVRPMRYKGCRQPHNAQVVICALFTTRNSLTAVARIFTCATSMILSDSEALLVARFCYLCEAYANQDCCRCSNA